MHTQPLAQELCTWLTAPKKTTVPATTSLESFEVTAMPYLNLLYRTARRTLGNQTEAEDIVQEVYLQAWQSFHRFTPGTNCRAWLFKIMFHVMHDHWRAAKRMVMLPEEEEELLFAQLIAKPSIPAELRDEDLLAALAKLPKNFRMIVELADIQEYAYKEIAEMLHIPIGTVMSRLSRGRKLLRQELASKTFTSLSVRGRNLLIERAFV